jgi:hypothetical protein
MDMINRRNFFEVLGLGLGALGLPKGADAQTKPVSKNREVIFYENLFGQYIESEDPKICIDSAKIKDYILIDLLTRRIAVRGVPEGYDAIAVNALYSYLQETFDESNMMQYPIPIVAHNHLLYSVVNDWSITEESIKFLADGALLNNNGSDYCVIKTVGTIPATEYIRWRIGENLQKGTAQTPGHINMLLKIPKKGENLVVSVGSCPFESTFVIENILGVYYFVPLFISTSI